MRPSLFVALAACSAPAKSLVASGIPGVELDGERIRAVTPGTAVLWPPVIDSHVHLAYLPVAAQLRASGVEAVVDLAAPERTLGQAQPIRVIAAGPMLTHDDGYPLDAWGSDGFGAGCHDAACVTATIGRLAAHGAGVIKLALDDDGLAAALVPVAVEAAHAKHLKVAAHALTDAGAALAGRAGVDILAHTPVEPLQPSTIALWQGRAVISTLAAFGGRETTIANLRALRAAGATILYGTDLGNTREAGPSADEIALLAKAGLDDAAITAAMTTAPAAYWGIPYGIAPGKEATLLVLDRDPRTDVRALLAPVAIYVRGERVTR